MKTDYLFDQRHAGVTIGDTRGAPSPNAIDRPPSGLSAAITLGRDNVGHASRLLVRLAALGDVIGGPSPGSAKSEGKSLPPMGHLGQLSDANATMEAILSSIEDEISRLEGLVG